MTVFLLRCLKAPNMGLIMDQVLTKEQRQSLIQLICYADGDLKVSNLNFYPSRAMKIFSVLFRTDDKFFASSIFFRCWPYFSIDQGSPNFFPEGRITGRLAAAGRMRIENWYTSTGWPISHFTFYKLNNFFSINIFLFFFSEFKNIILVNFWYGKVYNRTTSEDNWILLWKWTVNCCNAKIVYAQFQCSTSP